MSGPDERVRVWTRALPPILSENGVFVTCEDAIEEIWTVPRWAVTIWNSISPADSLDERAIVLAARSEEHRAAMIAILNAGDVAALSAYVRAYLESVEA